MLSSSLTHELTVLFVEFVHFTFADVVLIEEIVLESGYWIVVLLPRVHLVDRSVGCAVVRCAVMAQTIGHGLDQHWSRLLDCDLSRCSCGVVDGEQVVTVDSNGDNAVSWTSRGNTIASVLILDRRGNGVTIVTAEMSQPGIRTCPGNVSSAYRIQRAGYLPEEDDWDVIDGREVHGCVSVSFTRSALAEIANDAKTILLSLVSIGRADCLWHLSC